MKYIFFLLIFISIGAKAQTGFSDPVAYSNPVDTSKHKCQHVYVKIEQDTIRYEDKGRFPGPGEELICIICHKKVRQVYLLPNRGSSLLIPVVDSLVILPPQRVTLRDNRFREAAKKAAEQTNKILSQ